MLEQILSDGFSDNENDLSYTHTANLDLFDAENKEAASKFKLYVEGDNDAYVWKKFVEEDFRHEIVCLGSDRERKRPAKSRVVEIVNEANKGRNAPWVVLGVIDRDFDFAHICKVQNLFYYDESDLESMIIASGSFIETLGLIFKRKHENQFKWIQTQLLDATAEVGKLRSFLYYKPNISLSRDPSINRTQIERAIKDPKSLLMCPQLLCDEVMKEASKTFNKQEVASLHQALQVYPNYIPNQTYRRGHDAVRLLAHFVRTGGWEVFPKLGDLTELDLERYLLASFHDRFFRNKKIYRDVIEWNKENSTVSFFRTL
jgi:hypothetical protein